MAFCMVRCKSNIYELVRTVVVVGVEVGIVQEIVVLAGIA
jgi:hypothetical protein